MAERHPQLKTELEKSLKPVVKILDDLFNQLEFKGSKFQSYSPSVGELMEAGNLLLKLNPNLTVDGPWTTKHVEQNT